jgi:hypothetical protein
MSKAKGEWLEKLLHNTKSEKTKYGFFLFVGDHSLERKKLKVLIHGKSNLCIDQTK